MAGQGGKAGAHDEGEHKDLEDAERVDEPDTPFGRGGVEDERKGGARDGDAAGGPFRG